MIHAARPVLFFLSLCFYFRFPLVSESLLHWPKVKSQEVEGLYTLSSTFVCVVYIQLVPSLALFSKDGYAFWSYWRSPFFVLFLRYVDVR